MLDLIEGFADEIEKIALVQTALQPHQQRVVDRIQRDDQPGLVVAHGLGSGKTLTSIAAQEALGMHSDVVVPAALQANYQKEVAKHVSGKVQNRDIQSMQNVASKAKRPDKDMLIVDEAHRARDPGSKTYQALSKNKAKKRLLLTGSPFYNHPVDIAPLVNMAAGQNVLPANQQEFEGQFVRQAKISPGFGARLRGIRPGVVPVLNKRREGDLRETFGKWVDYHPGSTTDFPTVERENVNVQMTPDQMGVYETLMKQAPPWVAYKIRKGLPPNKQEAQQLNAFLSGVRQVSNTTTAFQPDETAQDPKIQKAFDNLKANLDANPNSKAVVYSNFLASGLNPYKQRLQEAGIPFGEFTGEMPKAQRDDLVRQYNENKIRALLLSSAGGEGLDLKGTRLMQILDPHWNDEKIKQVEGRGVRFHSHSDLPEADRKVLIQRYLATRPRMGLLEKMRLRKPGGSSDEYLAQRSAEKERLIEQFRRLLPQQAPAQVQQ